MALFLTRVLMAIAVCGRVAALHIGYFAAKPRHAR